MIEYVPETAIDYGAILNRGGANHGDEDFFLSKCPSCGCIYLLEYEVDTVYTNPDDLSQRVDTVNQSFICIACFTEWPRGVSWIGERAPIEFRVTVKDILDSPWLWCIRDLSDLFADENS